MFTCIEKILSEEDLNIIDRVFEIGEFIDGKKTAGHRAKRVKNNLQLDKSREHRVR